MINTLIKNAVAVILIIFTLLFIGCGNNPAGVKKTGEGATANSEQTNPLTNPNNDKINMNDIKTKTIEDVNILCDKLAKAGDANSINNILKEYYELNMDKVSVVYFANESGEIYLCPNETLPKDYDARKRPWYTETIKSTNFVSEQYQDMGSGKNLITFAKVVSKNNTNIGVVGVDRIVK